MLLQDLSRLDAIVESIEAPAKAGKARQGDTKKNRLALLAACTAKDMPALRSALEAGASANSHEDEGWSALALCATAGWVEGLRELTSRGADESLIEGYFDDTPWFHQSSCLVLAAYSGQGPAFAFLYPLSKPADQKAALDNVSHPSTYLACESLGVASLVGQRCIEQIVDAGLRALDEGEPNQERSEGLAALDAYAKRTRLLDDPAKRDALWIRATSMDSPRILQELALRGMGPDPSGAVMAPLSEIASPMDIPARWTKQVPWPSRGDPDGTRADFSAEARLPMRIGLATLALLNGSRDERPAATALIALEPLRREAMDTELGRHALASKAGHAMLRRLKALGEDLGAILDDRGRTPLHWAVERGAAKSTLEALARLSPGWIDRRDADGRQPIDLEGAERKAAVALLFDSIGMRAEIKGTRGKKTPMAAKRRL